MSRERERKRLRSGPPKLRYLNIGWRKRSLKRRWRSSSQEIGRKFREYVVTEKKDEESSKRDGEVKRPKLLRSQIMTIKE